MIRIAFVLACLACPLTAQLAPEPDTAPRRADEGIAAEPPMTLDRLAEIVVALDSDARVEGTQMALTVEDRPVLIVTDPVADRMRAMVPITQAGGLSAARLRRLMQANFDSALDARYAIANGLLWAAFIHPLAPLEKDQFISGLGQAVNAAETYGTLYTGGAMQFGGGDSPGLQRRLLDDLLRRGEDI